ncbi:MAG: type II secretion system secretin GspD, partial [Brachymonas sp.]|nr:type II secretion system secretin GspD [Brachymonas sp.]
VALQPARGQPITLNFANADIEAVARTMAVITGRNVVMDSRVRGTVTLQSEQPISPQQAINQFASALRMQGFALVESGNMYRIMPEADAKLHAQVVPRGRVVAGNQVFTQVFKLKYLNANQLLQALRPLVSPNNVINATDNSTLVVTDYADNLQRIARIIANTDMPVGSDVQIIPLHYGIATDLAPLVQRLMDGSASAMPGMPPGIQGGGIDRVSIVPEPRSNALIVRAPTQAQAVQAQSLILKLDQPSLTSNNRNGDAGNIWVVYLKHADAERLAVTLRAAIAANASAASPYGAAAPAATAQAPQANQQATTATSPLQGSAMPSTGGKIQADPSTNSLIITASEPEYRQLRAVIDRLDAPRAQVYVESLIVEVNANTAANLGVQWQSPVNHGSKVGIIGSNFGTVGNILAMSAAVAQNTLPNMAPGLNLAATATLRDTPILGFVANFLQNTGDANILSTPNLITLDNEEARIMIGKNVPFVTGSYTNNNSANGAVNPFQTITRQDVGLTLRVKPQINADGVVKMQVYQEVSSIDAATVNAFNGPTTNKRTIESNVLVADGDILVLGGLLSDQYSNSQEKIPLLGDIPLAGNLFKSQKRGREKTNLMVFLRP